MVDSTAAAPEPLTGFGMRGAFPDAMSMINAKAQGLAEATRMMLADAAEAPGRAGQAASLLTGNGEIGTIGFVLAAAAAWLAVSLLAALAVRRLLRPARARLHGAAGD